MTTTAKDVKVAQPTKSATLSLRDAYGKTLVELGKEDTNMVVMDADLSGSTRTILFGKAYPDRYFNVGVAEQNMLAIAAGLSTGGRKENVRFMDHICSVSKPLSSAASRSF